jgi:chaperonin cofactor prefoldin
MLRELPWKALKAYVQASTDLNKLCTLGGHRLDPKGRKRVESIILKEAAKAEYSAAFCNGVFAQWYPVNEKLHQALESYFHSDEYKEYREQESLDEDTYVLPEAKFDEFFQVADLDKWRALLCFSPLRFSDEQTERILNDTEGNADLIRRMAELEEAGAQLEGEKARLENEIATIRAQYEQVGEEVQKLRQARKTLSAERDGLVAKFERSQDENRRLREAHDALAAKVSTIEQETRRKSEREIERLTAEMRQAEEEMASWRTKYEEQRGENRQVADENANLELRMGEQIRKLEKSQEVIDQLRGFADLILDRIEWVEVGKQIKPTPAVKRQFNSLVRKLNYEEDRSLSIEGTLRQFWERLQEREAELIDRLAKSNTLEIGSGDVAEYWRGLTDLFEDVHLGLEARSVLLRILQEVFYQVFDMDDLKAPDLDFVRNL